MNRTIKKNAHVGLNGVWQCIEKKDIGALRQILPEYQKTLINQEGAWQKAVFLATKIGFEQAVQELWTIKGTKVGALIEQGSGKTPLHYAAQNGSAQGCAFWMQHVDVNAKDGKGFTALSQAVWSNQPQAVQILLKHPKVDVNVKDSWGNTCLMNASKSGFWKVLELLLEHSDVNVNVKNEHGQTALHLAAGQKKAGQLGALKALLRRADVSVVDNYGNTALHSAVPLGSLSVIKELCKYIDVKIKNNAQIDVLYLAIDKGTYKNKWHGACDVHQVEKSTGNTLLHRAPRSGDIGWVQYLIDQGLRCVENHQGISPLEFAVKLGHASMLKLLLTVTQKRLAIKKAPVLVKEIVFASDEQAVLMLQALLSDERIGSNIPVVQKMLSECESKSQWDNLMSQKAKQLLKEHVRMVQQVEQLEKQVKREETKAAPIVKKMRL